MRAMIAMIAMLAIVAVCAVSTSALVIPLHAATALAFTGITFGVSRGIFKTAVPDNEALTLLCGAPGAPVAMAAGCIVGGKVACDSMSSMLAFTSVSGHSGDVSLTVEAAGVAIADGGIVIDQRVECSMQRNRLSDEDRKAARSTNASRATAVAMEEVAATATFSMAGTDKTMVAHVAKYFKEDVVATAQSLGPFEHDVSVDVFAVDASGSFCSPTSSLPFMVLQDVSSQDGPLSCVPLKDDACGSMRCTLPWTTTRLSVTLRPSDSNAFSHDPLFAQVLVVPSASP